MARRPSVTTNVQSKPKPRPRFDKHFFLGLEIFLGGTVPDGLDLEPGEVYFGPKHALNARQPIYMLISTFTFIASDDDAISLIQREQAMGVTSKVVDVSRLPSWQTSRTAAPVVDRKKEPAQERHSLEQFVTQVTNLFIDLQGFDVDAMSDEVKAEFFLRYASIRDRAVAYRRLVAEMEGAFEVLQRRMTELT